MTDNVSQVSVRDAGEADVPALTAIKGEWSEAIHRDRLRDVCEGGFRYFVLTAGEEVVGYSCLVFQRPAYWLDANDTEHLPQIVDLQVDEFRAAGRALDPLLFVPSSASPPKPDTTSFT